jgi:hypothetical protein
MADYKPTDDELEVAIKGFMEIVEAKKRIFKIGRCADDGKGGLVDRKMYKDASAITSIWQGSAAKASWIEKALTRYAWEHFKHRCLNKQAGGGKPGKPTDTHHVYVVEWKATDELRTRVAFYGALREMRRLSGA